MPADENPMGNFDPLRYIGGPLPQSGLHLVEVTTFKTVEGHVVVCATMVQPHQAQERPRYFDTADPLTRRLMLALGFSHQHQYWSRGPS